MEGAQLERGLETHKDHAGSKAVSGGEFQVENWQQHYMSIKARLNGPKPIQQQAPISEVMMVIAIPEIQIQEEAQLEIETVIEEEPVREFSRDDMLITRGLKRDRIRRIILPILRSRNMTWDIIRGQNRHGPIVRARSEVFFALISNGYGYAETGRICGRDHTTVIHGVRKWKERNGPDYRGYLAEPREDARILLSTVCNVTEIEKPYKD
jgi:hypothetical protein